VEADSKALAEEKVDEACKKMLANQIMESYVFSLSEVI
jgi:phosphoribosylformylglycinamidine synthase